jgi:hypothetical protein
MSTTPKERYEVMTRLDKMGLAYEDACKLRRISLTLHRWFELECGDGNDYGSWAIERDETTQKPYMVRYAHNDKARRTPIADRETGARLRLAKIMARYPNLIPYIQTDPRGCALYLLTLDQANRGQVCDGGRTLDSIYSQGTAIY